jgi:hypothetical protein
MEKRRIEKSLQKQRGERSATHLLEQNSGTSAGRSGETMAKLLYEEIPHFSQFTINEAKGGKLIARGEFGRVGVPTENGRIYPEDLMNREFERLMESIKARRVLGELDHPADGKTSLKRVSHVITNLMIKDGIVIGEAEILNTPEGKTLRALIEANVQVGVSSRGYGSTQPSTGKTEGEIVQDDFVLKTYDFVGDPAMKTAVPGIFTEDVDVEDDDPAELFLTEFPEIAEGIKSKALEEAKKTGNSEVDEAIKATEERVRKELSENFERVLAETITSAKEELREELREELGNDPEVGGAKAILAQVAELVSTYHATPDEKAVADALKAKELEVAEATSERDEAAEKALAAAFQLHIERQIGKHPMADTIRKLLKGKKFESKEEVDETLKAVLADLPGEDENDDRVSAEEAKLREDNAELRGEVTLLSSKVEDLNSKLQKAAKLGERIDEQRKAAALRAEEAEEAKEKAQKQLEDLKEAHELSVYKHDRVVGLTNGRELLALMEDVNSKAAVDRLVREKGSREIADGELRTMTQSLKRGIGERSQSLTEDKPAKQPALSKADTGLEEDEMLELAGVTTG